jgi:hypothetical protein
MVTERNPTSPAAGRATLAQHERSPSPSRFLARLGSAVLHFDPALLAFLLLACAVVI